jgi:hypothetical protein
VRELAARGDLPSLRLGAKGHYRFRADTIDTLIRRAGLATVPKDDEGRPDQATPVQTADASGGYVPAA